MPNSINQLWMKKIMSKQEPIKIYTDGASRSNPGQAGAGVYIFIPITASESGKEKEVEIAVYLGETTNNQAEYRAALLALRWLNNHQSELASDSKIEMFLDSQLVVKQINKEWKIKHAALAKIAEQCWQEISDLPHSIELSHVRREKNKKADSLANLAIDEFEKVK